MDYLIEAIMGIFDEYEEYDDPEFKIKTEEEVITIYSNCKQQIYHHNTEQDKAI